MPFVSLESSGIYTCARYTYKGLFSMEIPDGWLSDDEPEDRLALPLTAKAAKKMGWTKTGHARSVAPENLMEMVEQYVAKSPAYKTK